MFNDMEVMLNQWIMKQNVDVTDSTICLFVCFSTSTGTVSELTLLIDKLQKNADKVQKNIYDIEQNLNKVHNRCF